MHSSHSAPDIVNDSDSIALKGPDSPRPLDEFHPGTRFYLAFATLCVVFLAAAIDATAISTALPVCAALPSRHQLICHHLLTDCLRRQIIAHELHGTAIQSFWTGTAFLLTNTIFELVFGCASESFGRVPLIHLSLLLFTVGSLVCALSRNFTTLLIGRTVQGAGGGGIISLTEVVITDLVPLRERGTWFGYQSAVWAVGSVIGPMIGGALAQDASWRWIFWINVPICVVAFICVILFLRLRPVPGRLTTKIARFDYVGSLLLIGSTTSFLMAVSWGDVMYPWSNYQTLLPCLLGAAAMVGFVVFEAYVPAEPLVRIVIFADRTALTTYFGTFIHGLVLWCLLYYLPLYYECVLGYSAILSGVAALPETFTVAPASIVVGVLVSYWGRFRWAIWGGWAVSTLGMGLLCLLGPHSSVPKWVFINLVPGIGLGMLYNSLVYGTQAPADERDVAYAASMYTFARSFGQTIGVAIGGAIFTSQFSRRLVAAPDLREEAHRYAADASGLVEIVRNMGSHDPRRHLLIDAYAGALKIVWAVMTALAFAGLATSVLTRSVDINHEHLAEQKLELGDIHRTHDKGGVEEANMCGARAPEAVADSNPKSRESRPIDSSDSVDRHY